MKRMLSFFVAVFVAAVCAFGISARAWAQGGSGLQWPDIQAGQTSAGQLAGQTSGRAIATVDGSTVSPLCAELARSGAGASVGVRVEQSAAGVLRGSGSAGTSASVMGFTVSLFRDNTQNARANSYEVAAQFSEAFPGIEVEVSYQAPWFRVTAGRFIDRTDAVAICGRAAAQFKKAVVVQQEFTLQQIIDSEKAVFGEAEVAE